MAEIIIAISPSSTSSPVYSYRLVVISEKNLNIYSSVWVQFLFLAGQLMGKTIIVQRVLSFIAVWETERIIKQYDAWKETGVSTTGDDKKWDTCFNVCFKEVLKQWINNQTYTV